jgi:DNA polymerase-3 subunit alpha
MAALISSVMSTKDKVPFFVNRCSEMGIEVLPPDVNSSDHGFIVSGNNIRFGLDAVKNVGYQAVHAILAAREADGEFASIWDFCERVEAHAVNKRAVECLIKCGALDSTGASRKGMLDALPAAAAHGQTAQEDALRGQGSIFDLGDGGNDAGQQATGARAQHPPIGLAEFEPRELLRLEKETLGTFLSAHPLDEVRDALRSRADCSLADLAKREDGSVVTVGGIVTEARRIRTRAGKDMMFATIDDIEGQVEMLVFNKAFEAHSDAIGVDQVVLCKGRVDHKEAGEIKLVVIEIEPFEPSEDEVARARAARKARSDSGEPIVLRIHAAEFGAGLVDDLKMLFRNHEGAAEVLLEMKTREGTRRLRFGDGYKVRRSAAFDAELHTLLGPGALAA